MACPLSVSCRGVLCCGMYPIHATRWPTGEPAAAPPASSARRETRRQDLEAAVRTCRKPTTLAPAEGSPHIRSTHQPTGETESLFADGACRPVLSGMLL